MSKMTLEKFASLHNKEVKTGEKLYYKKYPCRLIIGCAKKGFYEKSNTLRCFRWRLIKNINKSDDDLDVKFRTEYNQIIYFHHRDSATVCKIVNRLMKNTQDLYVEEITSAPEGLKRNIVVRKEIPYGKFRHLVYIRTNMGWSRRHATSEPEDILRFYETYRHNDLVYSRTFDRHIEEKRPTSRYLFPDGNARIYAKNEETVAMVALMFHESILRVENFVTQDEYNKGETGEFKITQRIG